MIDVTAWMLAAAPLVVAGLLAWTYSLVKNDVSIVDVLWSLMFVMLVIAYLLAVGGSGARGWLVLVLTVVWALRLAGHIAVRNHGEPEDRRYRAIRENNEPGFAFKSLYIVFGLQALLAWIIAAPLLASVSSATPLGALDAVAGLLWLAGMAFESIGDWQLARFRADPANAGEVLDQGLWRWSRHPNYFGECLLWWGFYVFAVAGGAWWTVFSPILMTVLLLRVSGVTLLERDIGERRPEYADYVRRTSAFVPWPPARDAATMEARR